ncbi:23S rRNA (uracil(1939)-C(5))-methyltransferase RlmD [Vreelandella aquamarina]
MAMLGKRRPARPGSGKSGLARQEKTPPKTSSHSDDRQLTIERLAHDGRGVAHWPNGKAVFVDQALPGEAVDVAVHRNRKRFDEAHVRERITSSSQRVSPVCAHFGRCGGCDLQHMAVDAQREHKRHVVSELLARQGLEWPGEIGAIATDETAYRRRARLGVNTDRDGNVLMGFRAQRSHRLVDIEQCSVLVPTLQALLTPLRSLLNTLKSPRDVGHIELLSTASQTVVLVRQLSPQPADEQRWQAFADQAGIALGMMTGRDSAQAQQSGVHWFGAEPVLEDTLALPAAEPLALSFAMGDFIQVNAAVNQQMVARVIDWLAPAKNEQILDLFAGIGNFSLPMAALGAKVHAVEGNIAMVARIATNARRHSLPVSGQQADLNTPDSINALLTDIRPDAVILDPPRSGAEVVCQALGRLATKAENSERAPRVAYVSCDPATLARDAAHLVHGGYRITQIAVADMFVHTAHMETLMLLEPT